MKTAMDGSAGRRQSARHPVIGICGRTAPVNWLGFDLPVTLLPQMYVDLLDGVGCTPVLLPLLPGIGHIIGRLDGLLLPGGGDVDPARYGAAPHAKTGGVSAEVDQAEMALLEQALATGLPFFGICRGLQVLNVLRGGTLHQYLPDITTDSRHQPAPGTYGTQVLSLRPDSHIARIYGGGTAEVSCYHHQAVDLLGVGLTATAWAKDGIIEAVEAVDHPFALGVQWHADQIGDERPFRAFAEAARCASERPAQRVAAQKSGA
jgi:putative glutamine amidotransferase